MSDNDQQAVRQWEQQFTPALRAAMEAINTHIIGRRIDSWPPGFPAEEYRQAATDAWNAMYWLCQPLKVEQIKTTITKQSYARQVQEQRGEAGGDE
jgi:hypothetical protein